MKISARLCFPTPFLFLVVLGFLLVEVGAIPAFARKYQTSCQTCHIAYPKLNAFGEAYRNNGYRFPRGDEDAIKDKPVPLGAPGWKRVWPKGVWPSDIPNLPPIAFNLTNTLAIRPDDEVTNEFIFPDEIEFLAGGTLGEDMSFYTSITLLEKNDFGGLHRLFIQFDSIKGKSLMNFKLGGFEPRATPFSSHRKLLKTNYLMNELQIGIDAALLGSVELGHGHGGSGPFSFGTQRGVEFWGATSGPKGGGFLYAVGVVNGNGVGGFTFIPAEPEEPDDGHEEDGEEEHDEMFADLSPGVLLSTDDHSEDEGGGEEGLEFLDNNSTKDVYWRAAYKFFGLGLTGLTGPGSDQPIAQTENWIDNSLRVGFFGARGNTLSNFDPDQDEDYLRYGLDFDLWFRDLNLFGAYMWQQNDLDSHDGRLEFDWKTWFMEADYVLLPWIIPAVRYEVAEFEPLIEAGDVHDETLPTIKRLTPHVTFLVRANIKCVLEANHYFDDLAGDLIRINFDFSF